MLKLSFGIDPKVTMPYRNYKYLLYWRTHYNATSSILYPINYSYPADIEVIEVGNNKRTSKVTINVPEDRHIRYMRSTFNRKPAQKSLLNPPNVARTRNIASIALQSTMQLKLCINLSLPYWCQMII